MSSTGVPTYNSAPLNSNEDNTHAATSEPQPATAIESSTTEPSQPPNASAIATAPSYSPIPATAQPDQPPAPQPGAAPSLPVPTATTASQPADHLSATPTTTFPTTSSQSPPAPQPGAVPTPASTVPAPGSQSSVPPPPRAGEAPSSSLPTTATATGAPAVTTPAAFTQSYAYHRPSHVHPVPNSTSSPYSSVYQSPGPSSSQGLPLHGSSSGGGGASSIFPDDEPGIMDTAKSWMQTAGAKLAEVEAEVWKRINSAHDGKD